MKEYKKEGGEEEEQKNEKGEEIDNQHHHSAVQCITAMHTNAMQQLCVFDLFVELLYNLGVILKQHRVCSLIRRRRKRRRRKDPRGNVRKIRRIHY